MQITPSMVGTLEIVRDGCDTRDPCAGHACIITLEDGRTTGKMGMSSINICSLIKSIAKEKITNNHWNGHFTEYDNEDYLQWYIGTKTLPSAESILTEVFNKSCKQ